MELKLFGIDFTKNTITFSVPREIMERATWSAGYAEIDLSKISDINPRQEDDEMQCVYCGRKQGHYVCPKCMDDKMRKG